MITNEQLQQIRSVSIIDLLSKQGYHPVAKKASGIWFKAPWRDENEPSLKVSPDLNVWFDFGAHVGGDAIALVEFQHNKHFSEACEMIQSLMNGLVFDSTPVQMPSKTVEYVSFRKPLLFFYKDKNDASLRYLEDYPCICRINTEDSLEQNKNRLVSFINAGHDSITYEQLMQVDVFRRSTPEYIRTIIQEAQE